MKRLILISAILSAFALAMPESVQGANPIGVTKARCVAYWDFNDNADPLSSVDLIQGAVGTNAGTAAFTADLGGHTGAAGDRALDFQGTNSAPTGFFRVAKAGFLNAGASLDQVTISFWAKHYSVTNSSVLQAHATANGVGVNVHLPWSDNNIYFDTAGCCNTTSQRINAKIDTFDADWITQNKWTNWHHYAFLKNASTKSIYIDGNLFLQLDNTSPWPTDFTDLYLGSAADGTSQWRGIIDDFAVFALALPDTSITALATGTSPKDITLTDTDNDGMPDVYEDAVGLNKDLNDAADDPDNDGLTNIQEYRLGTNHQNPDTDGDGLKDGVETGTGVFVNAQNTGTSPFHPDTDGDGLMDGVETGTGIYVSPMDTGTNPNKRDSDGDGFPDGVEVNAGTNPNDPNSVPAKAGGVNLLAFWNFNDDTDPAVSKDQVKMIPGTLESGAVFTADMGGHTGLAGDRAVDMGAGDNGQHVEVTNEVNCAFLSVAGVLDQFTISFWQKLNADSINTDNGRPTFQSSTLWAYSASESRGINVHNPWTDGTIYYDTGFSSGGYGRISANLSTLAAFTNDLTFLTAWHNYVFVKDATNKSIYIDGQLFTKGVNVGRLPDNFFRLGIGGLGSGPIRGLIDDFAFFASPLTPAQISAIAAGIPPTAVDPTTDTDHDGMPDFFELSHGLNPNVNDASLDPDSDGLTNLQEYQKGTDPQKADTDGDGLKDGVETGTGIFVSAQDTGTDPIKPDSDSDGLSDLVETGTGTYVSPTNTGTNPSIADTDGDGFSDGFEITTAGTNPNDATSAPAKRGELNLLAYWDFNDASNPEVTKDLITGIEGAMVKGAIFTDDLGGHTGLAGDRAADFSADGAGEAVFVTNVVFMNVAGGLDQMTISLWQKLYDVAQSSAFWGDLTVAGRGINAHTPWSDNVIYYDTGGSAGGYTRISANITTFGPPVDPSDPVAFFTTWHNFVFVKDGAASRAIYIDGKLFLSGTGTTPLPTNFIDLWIGSAGGASMHGLVDDFAVFAAALTPAEIALIASGTRPNNLPPRVSAPAITAVRSGTSVILNWGTGFKLQSSTGLRTTTWGDVAGATSPYTNSNPTGTLFYRLISTP